VSHCTRCGSHILFANAFSGAEPFRTRERVGACPSTQGVGHILYLPTLSPERIYFINELYPHENAITRLLVWIGQIGLTCSQGFRPDVRVPPPEERDQGAFTAPAMLCPLARPRGRQGIGVLDVHHPVNHPVHAPVARDNCRHVWLLSFLLLMAKPQFLTTS